MSNKKDEINQTAEIIVDILGWGILVTARQASEHITAPMLYRLRKTER
jgi:hypothetical protein